MCGIGGIRRFPGATGIKQDQVDLLLCGLQSRGIDASGVALNNPDGVHVYKNDIPAWEFVSSLPYKKFMSEHLTEDTKMVIVHTRMATKGNPIRLNNNHPMHFDKVAVVHNGVISNDDTLFRELQLDRHAETDSDILRAILDKEGLTKVGIRRLARCLGSVACAAISPEQPEALLLVRSGSPLVVAAYENCLVWASEKGVIHKAMRPWVDRFGLKFQQQKPDIAFMTMRDNSAWLFGPEGLEEHEECRTTHYYREPDRLIWGNYEARKDRWKDEEKRRVSATPNPTAPPVRPLGTIKKNSTNQIRIECPHCKVLNKLTIEQYQTPPERLLCGGCNKLLAAKV